MAAAPTGAFQSANTARATRGEWLALALAQTIWWLAVLGGATIAAVLLLLQATLMWQRWRWHLPYWRLVVLIAMTGLLLDGVTVAFSAVVFRKPFLLGIPIWLAVLWLSFALSVPSLWRLLSVPCLRIAIFAVAGPLAYFGGSAFGAATVLAPLSYVLLLLAGWLLLPALWWQLARGVRHAPTPDPARISTD